MPWYARYDYVEYWEYVPPEQWDSTPDANQWHPFRETWRDDFDTFDETRWTASEDWTFGVNDVTFWSSQVYTEDGSLVLKMEPRDPPADGGNTGGGGGSTDSASDCGCQQLLDTIALLREQLDAFESCSSNGGTDSGGSAGGDGTDNGGSTGGGGTNDGGSTGGGGTDNGGSTGGGSSTDNNFDLQFAGTASASQ
jgi:hypothetical protein